MEIVVFGTSQSVAPAAVRERLHVDSERIGDALRASIEDGVLAEAMPLVTCARMEIYAVAPDAEAALDRLCGRFADHAGASPDDVAAHSYRLAGSVAVRHLFRVAAGLDSVVHGEAQILGQVRGALTDAAGAASCGPRLRRLFESALRVGKRVRTETEIGQGTASLASAAVALIRNRIGPLDGQSALVIGAGETGALVGRLLGKAGIGSLTIVNRTEQRARDLAKQLGAQAASLDALPSMISGVDLVVGAAAAPDRLLDVGSLNGWSDGREARPLYLLDLAHPGNFDPELSEVAGVHLVDLEQVFERVEEARATRAAQAPRAESIVDEHSEAFMGWLRSRDAAPVLRAIREQFLDTARAEAERLSRGNGAMGSEQMTRFARSLARTLLHAPTVALRGADPGTDEGRLLLESAAVLFGVDPDEPEERP